jgi:hypothetical protein
MEVGYRVITLVPVHIDHHTIEGADPRHGTTIAEVPGCVLAQRSRTAAKYRNTGTHKRVQAAVSGQTMLP